MVCLAAALGDVSQLFQAVFTAGLLLVAVAAVIVAGAQLGSGRKAVADQIAADLESQRRVRVYRLADRTTRFEFVVLMSGALSLFRLDHSTWEKWWRDRPLNPENEVVKQQAVVVLNFCEEIASEYLDGLLAKNVADKNVAYIATSIWRAAEPFVKFLRDETDEHRAWNRLEVFATEWRPPEPETSGRTSERAS